MEQQSELGREWCVLQNNHEQYERSALLIKLVALVLCLIGLLLEADALLLVPLLLMLWLMEGIYKTFQARLGARLLRVERLLAQGPRVTEPAFQLHTEWLAARPDAWRILSEYAASAASPTVAFPYALLVLLSLALEFRG